MSISNILGVLTPLNTGRYLGLPSLIGRNKRVIFAFLRERMWNRLKGGRQGYYTKQEKKF